LPDGRPRHSGSCSAWWPWSWRGGRALRTATRALNALGLGLALVALIAIVPTEVQQFTATSTAAPARHALPAPAASVLGGSSKTLRDIWVLVFDRYGSAESLRLNYGIQEKLTPWLADRGFHITPGAHANYQRTSFSLASSLNLDYLEALREGRTIQQLLKDHAVGRFLTDLGYRYVHIGSHYEQTRTAERATVNRRLENTSDFATGVIDSSLAGTLMERLGYTKMDIRRQRQLDWARFELDAIDQTVNEAGPKFVFAHLLLPHPPYVFDEHGNSVPDDVDAKRSTPDSYEAQMRYLDTRVEALVDRLLDVPEEERPIIVLMADEGPYPKRYEGNPLVQGPDPDFDWSSVTDEELRIKFGILHAMLLPGVEEGAIPEEMTSVNTFRFLLSEYFGADLPLLPNRILIGPGFEDVAARLGVEP
jgi:Sulfatase